MASCTESRNNPKPCSPDVLSDAEYDLIFAALSRRPAEEIDRLRTLAYPPAPPEPEGFTYFMSCGEGGPIKIGFAKDVEARRRDLETGSPYPLIVLATRKGPPGLERYYHGRFARHRERREWFSRHPDILREIDRLDASQHSGGMA